MGKRGIKVPVTASRGRLATEEAGDQLSKIILLAMASGDNDNPWAQDEGTTDVTFGLPNSGTRALVERSVRRNFERLARDERARLSRVTITEGADGDLDIAVTYVDLESRTERDVGAKIGV